MLVALAAIGAVFALWKVECSGTGAGGSGAIADERFGRGEQVVLTATGYIVAAHKIEVASKVNGRVAWIGVDKGDKVKAGQVLVRLEDDEYRAQVTQQQGQLANLQAKLQELQEWLAPGRDREGARRCRSGEGGSGECARFRSIGRSSW